MDLLFKSYRKEKRGATNQKYNIRFYVYSVATFISYLYFFPCFQLQSTVLLFQSEGFPLEFLEGQVYW